MRKYGWEDFALPLTLVFAVTFALTLRHQINLPAPVGSAVAATDVQPDYVMTITARRLPGDCRARSASLMPASCQPYLTGDAVVEMHEQSSR